MDIINLELEDSRYIEGRNPFGNDWRKTGICCHAINKLNNELSNGEIETYSLKNLQYRKKITEKFIWYEIVNSGDYNGKSVNVATEANFYCSHYIGIYSTKINDDIVNVSIVPRFGNDNKFFNYLLSYNYALYLPKGSTSYNREKNKNFWLMAILWKASLEKALTKSHIPKEYKKQEKNINYFKGRLNISQQIKLNLIDESKFYCRFRKLSMDTTINRTVRYVYRLLEKKGFKNILKNISEYEKKLHSFGVKSEKIYPKDINDIKYSKLDKHYKQVMQLSKAIISNYSAYSNFNGNRTNSYAYFLDIAELWENYLLKILQKELKGHKVYSPNRKGGEYLAEDNYRQIRPDIIIEKDTRIVAILDAKYKRYVKIGKTANDYKNVSRNDLYQMITYLYHYGNPNHSTIGLFVSPVDNNMDELLCLSRHPNHKIGVINLNIVQWQKYENNFTFEKAKEEEKRFIGKINELLL